MFRVLAKNQRAKGYIKLFLLICLQLCVSFERKLGCTLKFKGNFPFIAICNSEFKFLGSFGLCWWELKFIMAELNFGNGWTKIDGYFYWLLFIDNFDVQNFGKFG